MLTFLLDLGPIAPVFYLAISFVVVGITLIIFEFIG